MTKSDLANERKLQIIHATIDCISRFGYNNFSMQDVAKSADVSKGNIHYYFLNKEELMMAVLDRVAGDIEGLLSEQEAPPLQRLQQIVQICFNVVQTKREYYRINMDFWTQINQKENVRNSIAKHYAKFRGVLERTIQEAMDSGQIAKANATFLASSIIALVDGLSLQWLFDEQVFDYDQAVKSAMTYILSMLKPIDA